VLSWPKTVLGLTAKGNRPSGSGLTVRVRVRVRVSVRVSVRIRD
jgi:hypothetical protein